MVDEVHDLKAHLVETLVVVGFPFEQWCQKVAMVVDLMICVVSLPEFPKWMWWCWWCFEEFHWCYLRWWSFWWLSWCWRWCWITWCYSWWWSGDYIGIGFARLRKFWSLIGEEMLSDESLSLMVLLKQHGMTLILAVFLIGFVGGGELFDLVISRLGFFGYDFKWLQ